MKIINIGVLAHVDAGKTTLTESLLYNSGAITELGSVDRGTTKTDNTLLERQRGITIQTAITSFQWKNTKINIIDTPGHMDFFSRSISFIISIRWGNSTDFCKRWRTSTNSYIVSCT